MRLSLESPRAVRVLWILLAVLLLGSVAVEFLVHPHGSFGIDGTFAFHAWYGFASCVALILVAKVLGIFIKRPDTYYDR